MFPLSQPALCLDSGGLGEVLSSGECRVEKGASARGRWGKTDKWKREIGAERETEKLAFKKKNVDRLPLKISYWISLTDIFFSLDVELKGVQHIT